ncbi:biotin/lipoyl-containing protein [Flexithrix dorotheae]|uniref:biotin/lipoyl-containing protein n=1 Tax=Flexithrix dorotheae TaxID=70993 RepID=UPI00036A351E|nr:biotin/lipoyl-containing protein [Flexithrix dorotheae]
MGREIKFSLMYRDMWQSSGKYMPRVDQLVKIAPVIVDMGCFARVETNGGGFEQINLLFGENPNKSVRAWTQPFNDAGILTHMLERGLNGIRMSPVPADVRKLLFKVKKKQGTDIARSFDGLNHAPNIIDSIKYAKEGGMIAQGTLCLTHSKIHTVEYYIELAEKLIAGGADEICLKDMAGIGRPVSLGKIVKGIKVNHPDIIIQYHGHSGPGFAPVSILEVARAGADIIDVGMEPLSWGTGHTDLLTAYEILKDDGFSVPDINMKAYMEARSLTQEFIDDFLGYYINPRNRYMNSLLIGPGLPGGMMGSLMADLENNLASLNKWITKRNKPTVTQDELLVKLFEEVEYIWPKLGYPPLVTPYSQYVKNVALMNVIQMFKGKERWSMIADNIWDMILGKSGQLPGKLDQEIIDLAKAQNREFFSGNPQDLYPDALPEFRKEMEENGWEFGEDDEELMELAMHPEQYRAYKSGAAKKAFEEDLQKRKGEQDSSSEAKPVVSQDTAPSPKTMNIDVNGEQYRVTVSYGDHNGSAQVNKGNTHTTAVPSTPTPTTSNNGHLEEILAPVEGKFFKTKNASETAIKIGDQVNEGDIIGYIESMKVYNAISADKSGKVVEICFNDGESVDEDDALIKVQ